MLKLRPTGLVLVALYLKTHVEQSQKEKVVNAEPAPVINPVDEKTVADDIEKAPLAPIDPRLRKPGDPVQANQDPLNGVNE